MFNYETLQGGVYPDLQEFHKACDNAEVKNIFNRDITGLFKVLERPLKVNLRLRGIVKTRHTALRCFTWSIIERGTDKVDTAPILSRVYDEIEMILEKQIDTELFGRICFPIERKSTDAGTILKVLDAYKPYEYDFSQGSIYHVGVNNVKTLPGKDEYLLYAVTYDAVGGLLRVLMEEEILRYDQTLEYANFLKKLKGILQIINSGGSKEDEDAAYDAARTLIKNNFVVTGDEIEFKLNEAVKNTGAAFKEFLDRIDARESIAVLGQANTTQLPNSGGSRAALQVMKMISADIFYSDMIRVEKLVNNYLLMDFRVNHLPNATMADMPYLFRLNIEEEEDIEKNAIAIREILASGLDLKKDEVYRKIGFTMPEAGDVVLKGVSTSSTTNLPKTIPGT